ncbi:hypothetical protein RV18_GL000393 [Enterococcus termitis]|nr:hypothetical protein RV18_GL000393 [Enterococcus termitis]
MLTVYFLSLFIVTATFMRNVYSWCEELNFKKVSNLSIIFDVKPIKNAATLIKDTTL